MIQDSLRLATPSGGRTQLRLARTRNRRLAKDFEATIVSAEAGSTPAEAALRQARLPDIYRAAAWCSP